MTISGWRPGDALRPDPRPTVEFTCYHCHQVTRAPARALADAEAEHWKERHDRLMASLNDVVKRCHLMHGDDPMHQWFLQELIRLRERMNDGA